MMWSNFQESDQVSSGVGRVIGLMEQYNLTKDDWDSIVEVGHFEGRRDPLAAIPSKVCKVWKLLMQGNKP